MAINFFQGEEKVGSLEDGTPEITDAYLAFRTETKKAGKKEYIFTKIDRGTIAQKLYIVVESKGLVDKNVKVSLCSASKKVLTEVDSAIKLLYGTEELSEKELKVDNYQDDADISIKNKTNLKNKTIFEITLNPEKEEDKKDWFDKLSESDDKEACIYIKVEVKDADKIRYNGKGNNSQCFLYEEPFVLKQCYCKRDLTANEIKKIIVDLRKNTYSKKLPIYDYGHQDKLFAASNLLEDSQKGSYKEFAKAFNYVCTKYEINTCIRKIHFLAQSYVETEYMSRLRERADGKEYDLETWENRLTKWEENLSKLKEIDQRLKELSKITEKNEEQKKEEEEKKAKQAELFKEKSYNGSLLSSNQKYEAAIKIAKDKAGDDDAKTESARKGSIRRMGNDEYGDGIRYRGRGMIHTTWRKNYVAFFEEILKDDKYKEKLKSGITIAELKERSNKYEELLEKYFIYACGASGVYWEKVKINAMCDEDDIFKVSRAVNSPYATSWKGVNAMDMRDEACKALKKIFLYPDNCLEKNEVTSIN